MDYAKIVIRRIEIKDNPEIAQIIRSVMTSFGASGEGFSINDPEVDHIYEAYQNLGHAYFVITDGVRVYGGGGIGPLAGEEKHTCELKKMYFLPEIRGQGFGQKLMDVCLNEARNLGYLKCYLETLLSMEDAIKLYRKNNFQELSAPLGKTGHFSCDSFFVKNLK